MLPLTPTLEPLTPETLPAPFGPCVQFGDTLRVEIANLTPQDCIFLGGLHALFCDPARADELAHFRSGHYQIIRHPVTGQCQLGPCLGRN